jgi:hypothetical protein
MNSLVDIQSGCIASKKLGVTAANSSRFYQPGSVGINSFFPQERVDVTSVATTKKLLDGAIAFARKGESSNSKLPALSPWRWVWRLAGFYHLCHSTPRLMEEARKRFAASGRESLAQWAAQKAREEGGHEHLALLDIQSMGYQAEAVVKTLVPPAAKALIDYFTQSVYATDPIGCVGYSYTMERLAMGIGEKYIQTVETMLPPDVQATRCLRVHSCVGGDLEHVEETVEMVAELAPQERNLVTIACYETALLCFNPLPEGYISEEELQNLLRPLKLHTCT